MGDITAAEVTLTRVDASKVPQAAASRGSQRVRVRARYAMTVTTSTNNAYRTSTGIPISAAFTTDATKLIDSGINISQQIIIRTVSPLRRAAATHSPMLPSWITHAVGSQPAFRCYQANGGAAALHALTEFADNTDMTGATGFGGAGPHVAEFEVEGELRPGVTLASLGIEET